VVDLFSKKREDDKLTMKGRTALAFDCSLNPTAPLDGEMKLRVAFDPRQ